MVTKLAVACQIIFNHTVFVIRILMFLVVCKSNASRFRAAFSGYLSIDSMDPNHLIIIIYHHGSMNCDHYPDGS